MKCPHCYFLLTDINPAACEASKATARQNQARVEVVRTETVQGLAERLHHSVDLLLCNPPYVATEEEEKGGRGLTAAWAGGREGLGVTRQVIDSLELLLSQTGAAYLVLEQCNQPASVRQYVG